MASSSRSGGGPTAMHRDSVVTEDCDRLVAMSRRAFDVGEVEMAYHEMAAALHGAESLEDDARITAIAHLADEQLAWLDAHRPEHQHSSAAAAARGHPGIYRTLAMHARAGLLKLRTNAELEAMRDAMSGRPDPSGPTVRTR